MNADSKRRSAVPSKRYCFERKEAMLRVLDAAHEETDGNYAEAVTDGERA